MMKRVYSILALALGMLLFTACPDPDGPDIPDGPDESWRQQASTTKLSGITYQLNVYSFADSDGDGWGDIRGITQHLDYLDSLGATALWLSPVHPAMSYHGYNVNDYYSVSPKLGTEADLKDLIDKAKAKNIAIYLDFVLNHSGKDNAWFQTAVADPSSPYYDYYVFSDKPGESVTGGMGRWYSVSSGSIGYHGRLHFKLDVSNASQPKLTITQTTDAAQGGNTDTSVKWFIYENNAVRMYKTGSNIYEITLDINNDWGVLVKDDPTQWGDHKWGAKAGDQVVEFGKPKTLVKGDAANDIVFGGSSIQYYASFDASMPDLYYGPYATASQSNCFQDMAGAADKWIKMGVAGLRLDAVIWIYQEQTAANVSFLKQWYDRCNSTWKSTGGQGDFYMVGEAWCGSAAQMAPYYEGLPSNFNFYYGNELKKRISNGKGDDFAKTINGFQNLFRGYRSDFIDAIFLSNHDQDRFASDLGRDLAKEKLAAAVLLTSPGKPYVYQGEELGYWGTKSKGDEYVRTPIKWTREGSVPSTALNGKVDNAMLSADISVEAQEQDRTSLLRVYRDFAKARNGWKALAKGQIEEMSSPSGAVALWKMSYEGQTVVVAHNFGSGTAAFTVTGCTTDKMIVSNGVVTASSGFLSLGPYASAVILQ